MNRKPVTLAGFRGLNNVADPLSGTTSADGKPVTWQWATQADNVDISDEGRITRRDGYQPFLPGTRIEASFSTFDYQRLYVVDGGALLNVREDGSADELASGLSGPYSWAEVNDEVFLCCADPLRISKAIGAVEAWRIPTPDGGSLAAASGDLEPGIYQVCFTHLDEENREGGASPAIPINVTTGGITVSAPMVSGLYTAVYVCAPASTTFRMVALLTANSGGAFPIGRIDQGSMGRELSTQFLDPLPDDVQQVAHWRGRIYGAQYLDAVDQTVVWFSQSLGYHLFDRAQDFFMVPGRVLQLADADEALLVGTDTRIFFYTTDGLGQVAEYGMVPGQHADRGADGKTYFWTLRGLCRAAPFENVTESRISVQPGIYAGGGVIHEKGCVRYVATLHSGGAAFNPR